MSRKQKVLLVDDVHLSIEMEKSALSRTTCEIITARTGKEALELIRSERPDLVVLDMNMPEMSGDECCRIVKSDPELRHIPIIMISMYVREEYLKKCYDAGCDDFIAKPFSSDQFLKKLESHLNITVRENKRIHESIEVSFSINGGDVDCGRLDDISEGGLFVEYGEPCDKGEILQLAFKLPGPAGEIKAEGKVVRRVFKRELFQKHLSIGMGIQFTDISDEGKEAIRKFLKKAS